MGEDKFYSMHQVLVPLLPLILLSFVLTPLSGQSQSSFHDAHLSDSVGAKFQHLLDQTTLRNMTKRRRSSLGLNGMKVFSKSNHHELLISEILEVRDDMSTDIMRRAIAKKFVDEYRKPSLVISLILRDRSINFEIEEVSLTPSLSSDLCGAFLTILLLPLLSFSPLVSAGPLGSGLLHSPDPRGLLSSEMQATPQSNLQRGK
jgi:hypothetical protein